MNEYTLQAIAALKLCWVAAFAFLYGRGGISQKWIRRFIGPLWMGVGLWIFGSWQGSWQWLYLLYPLLLCLSLHLGYGGTDNVIIKIRKRAIYGLAIGASAIPLSIASHLWGLLSIHIGLCIVGSVLLGVYNPSRNARSEEVLIATLSTVLVLFLI